MLSFFQANRQNDVLDLVVPQKSASNGSSSGPPLVTQIQPTPGSSKKKRKYKPDTWDIEKRKAYFYLTPTHRLRQRMEVTLGNTYAVLDPNRDQDDCWLLPSPPAHKDGRPRGSIRVAFNFDKHRYSANIGNVAMVLQNRMTSEQRYGIIHYSWHASHLCGNSICVNGCHFTAESASENSSRNGCMGPYGHCSHNPPCMRDLKRSLLLTQILRDKIYNCVISTNDFNCTAFQQMQVFDMVSLSSRTEFCQVCKRTHYLAPFCAILTSRKKVEILLTALATCSDFTTEKRNVISNLKKIKADLELRDRIRSRGSNSAETEGLCLTRYSGTNQTTPPS